MKTSPGRRLFWLVAFERVGRGEKALGRNPSMQPVKRVSMAVRMSKVPFLFMMS
jgi:hypothetical protein